MPNSPDVLTSRTTRSGRVVEPADIVAPENPQKHGRPHTTQKHDRINEDGELTHVLPEGVNAEDVAALSRPHK